MQFHSENDRLSKLSDLETGNGTKRHELVLMFKVDGLNVLHFPAV